VVVLPDDWYQGVAGLVAAGAESNRWSVERLAVEDTAGWIRACGAADLIWLESPSNPLLAERLEKHPIVTRVRYPGLPSHPTHATARRVLRGFGNIISFDLLGGAEFADDVCRSVRLIRQPRVSEPSNPRWNEERRSRGRTTFHPRSCD
jgi:cystathionine beta-lyase/cystathionine gamma-synthase